MSLCYLPANLTPSEFYNFIQKGSVEIVLHVLRRSAGSRLWRGPVAFEEISAEEARNGSRCAAARCDRPKVRDL